MLVEMLRCLIINMNIAREKFMTLEGPKHFRLPECWKLKGRIYIHAPSLPPSCSPSSPSASPSLPFFLSLTDTQCLVLEKAMAPHSSTLAWKIPWMVEPGRLQSKGSLRVGHDWATSLSLFTFMHWRRKWQPTPMFLPGESQGQGSLVDCRLWGRTESDVTEVT